MTMKEDIAGAHRNNNKLRFNFRTDKIRLIFGAQGPVLGSLVVRNSCGGL